MNVVELVAALEERKVRVVTGRHLLRDDAVNYRDTIEEFQTDESERRHLDTRNDGVIVRRSGWVWIIGAAGRIYRGFAGSDDDTARIDASLEHLLDALGRDTIGPDDDPVFAVTDDKENPDDPSRVAD